MAKQEKEEAPSQPKTATYIGAADVRVITAEDFRRSVGLDVGDMPALVWHAGNRFALPVEDLPSEVVDHLDEIEPDIVVENGVPDRLKPFLRTKVLAVSPSGRRAGVQAAEGRTEFPSAHPESRVEGEQPVISPEMAAAAGQGTASGEGQAAGGGNTSPTTTTGGSTAGDTGGGTGRGTRGT